MSSSSAERGGFATNLGFVLAAAGSAVGLGNIWKFPFITGVNGGGAFVLVYLGCVLLVGLPLMYAELIIGQRGGKDVLGALRELTQTKGPAGYALSLFTGLLAVATGFFILSFYSVVGGWAIHFFALSLGVIPKAQLGAPGMFDALTASPGWCGLWHTVFMGLTITVVAAGVHGGIERLCKILMPALVLMLLGLLVYMTVEGGVGASLAFLFKPDFSKLSGQAVLEALGHAFFTLSLGMGAMVTYGSYLKSERKVIRDSLVVVFMDTAIALLAGTVIFAVVFRGNLEPESGPGLAFVTLPKLFVTMPGGMIVSAAFFLLVIFAAWTSAVSLLEVVVAYFVDERGWNRRKATMNMGGAIWLIGLTCAYTFNNHTPLIDYVRSGFRSAPPSTFTLLDELTTWYMLPIGGFCIALAAGWFLTREDRLSGFQALGAWGRWCGAGWQFTIRYLSPVLILLVIAWHLGLI